MSLIKYNHKTGYNDNRVEITEVWQVEGDELQKVDLTPVNDRLSTSTPARARDTTHAATRLASAGIASASSPAPPASQPYNTPIQRQQPRTTPTTLLGDSNTNSQNFMIKVIERYKCTLPYCQNKHNLYLGCYPIGESKNHVGMHGDLIQRWYNTCMARDLIPDVDTMPSEAVQELLTAASAASWKPQQQQMLPPPMVHPMIYYPPPGFTPPMLSYHQPFDVAAQSALAHPPQHQHDRLSPLHVDEASEKDSIQRYCSWLYNQHPGLADDINEACDALIDQSYQLDMLGRESMPVLSTYVPKAGIRARLLNNINKYLRSTNNR